MRTDSSVVTESFDVLVLLVALDISQTIGERWQLFARGAAGQVAGYDVNNSHLGNISGSGGSITEIRAGATWRAREDMNVGLALRYDFQQLDAEQKSAQDADGTSYTVELPDNELERTSFELFCVWDI